MPHSCQRVYNPEFPEGMFAVTDVTDERKMSESGARLCGRPAFYKQAGGDGTEIWICVDCFNEFEGRFGAGSWTDASKFHDASFRFHENEETENGQEG